jgi:hypothetical protein
MNALLLMRRLSKENDYASIESIYENFLVPTLTAMDRCVTSGTAEQCSNEEFRGTRDKARHCSFELVSVLDRLAAVADKPEAPSKEVLAALKHACP